MNAVTDQLIVRYLLGDLPEDDSVRLEDQALADRETLRHIEDAENDLMDDYVRGALGEIERRQFESRFLASAERQRKVEFARALARIVPAPVKETAAPSWWEALTAFLAGWNPALQFSMAAAALVFAFGALWLFNVTRGLRSQVEQLQAQRQQQEETLRQQAASERARHAELAAQLDQARTHNEELARQLEGKPAPSIFATLFLPPGIARGSDARPQFVMPPNATSARLRIGLERGDDYASYRVTLSTAQGQTVWTQDRLRPNAGRVIQITIPASKLSAGQYELTLKGVTAVKQTEDVHYYYFDVRKK
jgi:hypothetical protein